MTLRARNVLAWAVLGLLLCVGAPTAFAAPRDFALDSDEWHGLAKLQALAVEEDIELRPMDTLDYATLAVERPLLLIAPSEELSPELQAFFAAGGRGILLDEGEGSSAFLAGLSEPIVRIAPVPLEPTQSLLNGNPNLPVLDTPGRHPLLEGPVSSLAANHPSGFRSALPAVVYFDGGELGFAYDLSIGDGKLVVIGDSSVFINLMIDFADNLDLARNSLRYVCRGQARCVVELYTGSFSQRNAFSPGPPPPRPLDVLEEGLDELDAIARRAAQWVPERHLLRVMTLLLCIGLALIGLTLFPFAPPRFLAIRFQPPEQLLPRSAFERHVEDFAREAANPGANFALPIAILREEFERIFLRELFGDAVPDTEARYRPSFVAEAAQRYAQRLGGDDAARRRAGRLVTELLRSFAAVPAQPQIVVNAGRRWTRRELVKLYRDARSVLTALGVDHEYRRSQRDR